MAFRAEDGVLALIVTGVMGAFEPAAPGSAR